MTDFERLMSLCVPVETSISRARASLEKLAGHTIRDMTEADIPHLLDVERASFPDDPYQAEHFKHWLGQGGGSVAEVGGRPVGYLLHRDDPDDQGFRYGQSLAVHPDHRRAGLGEALMSDLVAKYPRLSADVDTKNAASKGLLKKLGFKPVRTFSENGRRAHRMQLDKPYRDRAELYAMKDGKLYGSKFPHGGFGVYGGGIDEGEDAATAAAREFAEEAGWNVNNVRELPFEPHTLDWKPPYSNPKVAERAKRYRGSRTRYFVGDLGDQIPNAKLDEMGRKDARLYDIDEAMGLAEPDLTDPDLVAANKKRAAVLQHLKGLGAEKTAHYKKLCRKCDKVIVQCRCPGPVTDLSYGVCEACGGEGDGFDKEGEEQPLKHILIGGHSGSGKTTLANKLHGETGYPVVSLDNHPFWDEWKQQDVDNLPPRKVNQMRRENNQRIVDDVLKNTKEPSIIEGIQLLHGDPAALQPHRRILLDPDFDQIVKQRLGRDRTKKKENPQAMGLSEDTWAKTRRAKARLVTQFYRPYLPRWRADPGVEILGRTKEGAFYEVYRPDLILVKRAADDESDRPFTICVDLDGTLAEQEKPFNPDSIGPPRERAVEWVRLFHKSGARIIIFTVRGDTELVKDWLDEHEVPYDFVNENPDQPPDSSGKVYADVYWDDRAYNAVDPDEHGPEILRKAKAHNGDDTSEDRGPSVTIVRQTVITISGPALLEAMGDTDGDEQPGGRADDDPDE